MSQDSQKYTIGQRVRGTVEQLLPYGVFVCLDDNRRAYIRRKELTWSGNIDPRQLWQKGEKIEGVVIKLAGSGQHLELSHRTTLPDPWDEFVDRFQQGSVVEGVVKSVLEYGIFVEIVPGIDGLVPLQDVAVWRVQQPEDVVWVGDRVEAVITHLDRRTKKVRLSIRARMRQLQVVADFMKEFNLFAETEPACEPSDMVKAGEGWPGESQAAPLFGTGVDPLARERVGRILVVDDHDEVRLPLVEWLRRQGYDVDAAKDAAEAGRKITQAEYGLLFVDLNLSLTDGLAFLRRIRQQGLNCQAALMSTPEWLAERSHEIEEIGVSEVFVKPLDVDDIAHLLINLGQGQTPARRRMNSNPGPVTPPASFYRLAASTGRVGASLDHQLYAGLTELAAMTPAEAGVIFRLDPLSRMVSITAQVGPIDINREAIRDLGASPVRDVIEEEENLLENQMTGRTRDRFRKLLALLSFESCLGAPIKAGGETRRAVFLFHRQPGVFNRYHLRDTLAAAALFSVAIEREQMEHRLHSLNELMLSGQLARGFSHEVYNKISGLEIQLRNLQIDCRAWGDQGDQTPVSSGIQQTADSLVATFEDLKGTINLFRQLMQAEEDRKISINETLQKTVSLLRPLMQKQRIKIETALSPGLPDPHSGSVRLQQAFLNIMLNAIQQMSAKPGPGGILNIATSYQNQGPKAAINIRFSDTGPGIHRRLWEKIFELGYTTRLGGTGQGLYITRGLIESLGGAVSVERSIVPLGATFLVELPMIMTEGK